jgi:hypothetical protein
MNEVTGSSMPDGQCLESTPLQLFPQTMEIAAADVRFRAAA